MLKAFEFSPMQRNTIYIFTALILSKGLQFVKDVMLANYFGVSATLDVFFYLLVLPLFIYNVINSCFNNFFIPTYLKLKEAHPPEKIRSYLYVMFLIFCGVFLALAALTATVMPHALVKVNSVLFDSQYLIDLGLQLAPWVGGYFFFYAVAIFFTNLLQAEHRYIQAMYPAVLIPLFSIAAIVSMHDTLGIISPLIGLSFGAMLALGITAWLCMRANIFSLSGNDLSAGYPSVATNISVFVLLVLPNLIRNFIFLIDQHIASLFGDGQLSVFFYGCILPDGLSSLISVSLGIAVFTYFSQWLAQNKTTHIVEASQRAAVYMTVLILPLCLFLHIFAEPIIQLVFQRGEFTAQDTDMVSRVMVFYVYNIYLSAIVVIATQIILSLQKAMFILYRVIIIIILKIILNIVLTKIYGLAGLPLATVMTTAAGIIISFYYIRGHGFPVFTRPLNTELAKSGILSAVLGGILIICFNMTQGQPALLRVGGSGILLAACLGGFLIYNNKHTLIKLKNITHHV